jgi:hypothetical protein
MESGRQVGGSCLASSGAGEARGSSPTASYNDYQISVPFEALVRGKLLRLGLCACTFVGRWSAASVSSTEVSVFVYLHGCFPHRLIQTSLLKKNCINSDSDDRAHTKPETRDRFVCSTRRVA